MSERRFVSSARHRRPARRRTVDVPVDREHRAMERDDTTRNSEKTHDGAATLTEVLAGYAEGGFTSGFSVAENTRLECLTCGEDSPASEVRLSSLRRLEGASDPVGMVAVVAPACPNCSAQGTVVLGF